MRVFKAMGTNWKQFLWTLFLLMNIALFYTFISFYGLQENLLFDGKWNPLCNYAFGCFLNMLDSGLRSGGGIADVIQTQIYTTDNVGHFFGRVVFDLSFFIIMITILLNLIFGMIIDAFGNLRDQKDSNEDDAKNVCFICGIDRSDFERYMNFEDHVNREHNKWDYIFFITYVKEKYRTNRTEMTQLENYVNERCLARNFQWFPQTRSLTLEKKKEWAQAEDDDDSKVIADTVKELSKSMDHLKKKILGPMVVSLGSLKEAQDSQKRKQPYQFQKGLEAINTDIREIKRKAGAPALEKAPSIEKAPSMERSGTLI